VAKPDYFLIVDTETTQDQLVADFGAVVVNRKGKIMTQCAVLIFGIYNDSENHPLFHMFGDAGDLWSKAGLPKRYERYNNMLDSGSRQLASKSAVNRWLERVKGEFNPYLTAYNLAFDKDKCNNTDIDLSMFKDKEFCLWYAAVEKWAHSKKYRQFILDNHFFIPPTDLRNMSYRTNAEVMTKFLRNDPDFPDEPHTALEDVLDYELPILEKLVNTTKKEKWLNPVAWNWRKLQVKDKFAVK
jgi:hypothetical protein